MGHLQLYGENKQYACILYMQVMHLLKHMLVLSFCRAQYYIKLWKLCINSAAFLKDTASSISVVLRLRS